MAMQFLPYEKLIWNFGTFRGDFGKMVKFEYAEINLQGLQKLDNSIELRSIRIERYTSTARIMIYSMVDGRERWEFQMKLPLTLLTRLWNEIMMVIWNDCIAQAQRLDDMVRVKTVKTIRARSPLSMFSSFPYDEGFFGEEPY